jgi:Fe2+ or Zn2+ uptake regulation protein
MYRAMEGEIREAFGRLALRRTTQRQAILEHLLQSPGHLTADEIFAALNRPGAAASRATVYNNLHALVRGGLLQEVRLGAGAVRYDINSQWHHHFLCERCGRLEDIDPDGVPGLPRRPRLGSRTIRNYQVLFRGLCERCTGTGNVKLMRRENGKSRQTGSGAGGRRASTWTS